MSTTTSTPTEMDSFEKDAAIAKFEKEFGRDRGDRETGIMGSALVAGIIFDWDAWVEENDLNYNRETFPENPTMVTGRTFGDEHPIKAYLFSSGGNRSYFLADYIEQASKILEYNIKSNLDRVYLADSENSLLVAEGDGFDVLIAHRVPPHEL